MKKWSEINNFFINTWYLSDNITFSLKLQSNKIKRGYLQGKMTYDAKMNTKTVKVYLSVYVYKNCLKNVKSNNI